MNARDELTPCRVALAMIRKDATDDAMALDGLPFSGKAIGTQFGQTLAMIDALAGIMDTLAECLADMPVEASP